MKKRLLTALVGVSVAIGWLFTMFLPFPVFSSVMGFFAATAVYEMLKALEVKNIPFKVICMVTGFLIPVYFDYKEKIHLPLYVVIGTVTLLSLIIMVLDFKNLQFEQVAASLFSAFLIPAAMSTVVLFRDVYKNFPEKYTKADGVFFILFAFFCSWMSDGCALFVGKALGKHKLAPEISPKKTVEGAVGGVLCNCLLCVGLYLVFKYKYGLSEYITPVWVIVCALVLAVISIFGDLAASVVKRRHGIKDFGNLLPGHGGVMDRFDSSVFVFVSLYAVILLMNFR